MDKTVDEADLDDYAALVLPGGVANPDNLRMHEDAVEFVRGVRTPPASRWPRSATPRGR